MSWYKWATNFPGVVGLFRKKKDRSVTFYYFRLILTITFILIKVRLKHLHSFSRPNGNRFLVVVCDLTKHAFFKLYDYVSCFCLLSTLRLGNLYILIYIFLFWHSNVFFIKMSNDVTLIPTQSLQHIIRIRLDHRHNHNLGFLFFVLIFLFWK